MPIDDDYLEIHLEQIKSYKEDQITNYCCLDSEVNKFLQTEVQPQTPLPGCQKNTIIGTFFFVSILRYMHENYFFIRFLTKI